MIGLEPGLKHRLAYKVPESKTVRYVFEDSADFAVMPSVFATAFLIGLIERACLEGIKPYLDWPTEVTVGTHINVNHRAPTPPGRTVTIDVKLTAVEGRRLGFDVVAHDGVHEISRGTHQRVIVDVERFTADLAGQ